MGLSASQARMLSLTSRLSDLELRAQAVSNSKIRLSDQAEQASQQYSDALDKQTLKVYSGLQSNGTASYIDATANNLTTYNAISSTDKQRFIKNSAGQMIVSEKIKSAYDATGGNSLYMFLEQLGVTSPESETTKHITALKTKIENSNAYNVSTYNTTDYPASECVMNITNAERLGLIEDLTIIKTDLISARTGMLEKAATITDVTEKANLTTKADNITTFLVSLSQEISWVGDTEIDIDQDYLKLVFSGTRGTLSGARLDGSAATQGINLNSPSATGDNINLTTILASLQAYNVQYPGPAASGKPEDPAQIAYYTNVYNEIKESGGCMSASDENMNSSEWLQAQIDAGNIYLYEYGSKGTGDYVNVSWTSGDSALSEVTNDKDTAKAEAVYETTMASIQSKDKRFDVQLADINTEHTAVQTEVESVKKVISKNIERSLKMFDA